MANQEQLDLLKQGVETWNQWRKGHRDIKPDLSGANLSGANLSRAMLSEANLTEARLKGADLTEADLNKAHLVRARASRANFTRGILTKINLNVADLREADLSRANLSRASLITTNLRRANLYGTDLSGANLRGANLINTYLIEANLDLANLTSTYVGWTLFVDINLSTVKGLETVNHRAPSTIGIDTIYLSHGNIPEVFLRGAGVDDTLITYIRSLVGKAIEYYSCFISYSSKDDAFASRLYADLQSHNVRCWFAPEDLKIGEKFWHRIDESIRLYDKLLVVLSQHSVESEWVEREVMAALEKERQQKRLVLFPITLDEAFKQTNAPWAADIRRSRHTGDFIYWKTHDDYQKAFTRLLRDLKAEAQKMESQNGTTNGG